MSTATTVPAQPTTTPAEPSEARRALSAVEAETGLPATDPLRYGSDRLLAAVLAAPAAGSGAR